MTSEKASCRKDKNQNIQVFVRLRPLNQREKDIKSLGVIEVVNNREVVVRQSQQTSLTKKFTFDRAFGPNTKQVEVYQDVVSPLIEEVLAGYNCTVFAYGQTGTGKTHTMVGENTGDETTWQNDPLAGIIPRALSQLFDELRISNTEYTVRVSYLELYNEELFDLLSSSEDNSKLRIYEDVTRKGSNIVNGLEEITVYNKNEVYKIMAQGQERKRVASTLMNAQSSRSHTVFTIVVHMKENSPEGEELVKIGKLNLVDLAGSENISKAGSDNPAKRERARECVNINQSLLTLGRVITALVERHPHIPYRESKLTRILQESLGGRTKTSIIATISPGHKDLEETMSTLEYAHRAKNIQNKPEVNQKMTKKAILKEYAEEIDRLKRDLQAARDKSGVYLANETFAEMTIKDEEQRKEIQALLLKKKAMEDERDRMVAVFEDLHQQIQSKDHELNNTKNKLNNTKVELVNTNNLLKTTKLHFEEQQHLVSKQRETERQLSTQARELLAVAEVAATQVASLHDTVDRRRTVESTNLQVTKMFRDESSQQRSQISSQVEQFTSTLAHTLNGLLATLDNYSNTTTTIQEQNRNKSEELIRTIMDALSEIKCSVRSQAQSSLAAVTGRQRAALAAALADHNGRVCAAVARAVAAVGGGVRRATDCHVPGDVHRAVQQWYCGATERVSALQRAHAAFSTRAAHTENKRAETARKQRDARRLHAARRTDKIKACIAEIEEEKALMQKRLTQKLTDIETERRETKLRLQQWMEEQQRLLEDRLQKKAMEIKEENKLLEDRIAKHIEWYKMQLEADEEELSMAEADLEENETGKDMLMKNISGFGKEFEEGTSSISIDMEWFSRNVVEIVEHIYGQLMQTLNHAKTQIQNDTQAALEANKASSEALSTNTCAMLDEVATSTQAVVDCVIHKIEETNTSTIEELSLLASSSRELASSTQAHQAAQSSTVADTHLVVSQFEADVRQALDRHADLEARYLTQEYRIYSPTGSTPARAQFQFPRQLAATSPHERILARYRAMRQNSHDDDCLVVEPENENRVTSDSESSTSDDSAVVFVAPSPPADTRTILKSTSETDIYIKNRQEQRGKENANRSVSNAYKKPSKLPAPSSHKKPLVDRNAIN